MTNIIPNDELVYSVPEVAQMLRIGRGAAYELVRNGEIRVLRVGRLIRIPRSSVEEYIRSHVQ